MAVGVCGSGSLVGGGVGGFGGGGGGGLGSSKIAPKTLLVMVQQDGVPQTGAGVVFGRQYQQL